MISALSVIAVFGIIVFLSGAAFGVFILLIISMRRIARTSLSQALDERGLAATRLDRANLIAAMRAALAAAADGERDPLAYLRDELDTLRAFPEGAGR